MKAPGLEKWIVWKILLIYLLLRGAIYALRNGNIFKILRRRG
jgi:hypothetical protein